VDAGSARCSRVHTVITAQRPGPGQPSARAGGGVRVPSTYGRPSLPA